MPIDDDFNAIQQDLAKAKADADANAAALIAELIAAQAEVSSLVAAVKTSKPQEKQWIGVNLEAIGYYMRNRMYADALKTSQNFYGGADANGDPTVDQSIIVISQTVPGDVGTYKFVCDGQATVQPAASYCQVVNVVFANGQTTADVIYTLAEDQAIPQLGIQIGNVVQGKVKNCHLYRPGSKVGDKWYGPAAAAVTPFKAIRFMDFLNTNNSTLTTWSQRPQPNQKNYTSGGCYEDALDYCRFTGKAAWLTIPAGADDNWATELIRLIRQMTSGPVYIEWGNECWNSSFLAWKQGMGSAAADKSLAYDGCGDPNILLWRWMAKKAASIGQAAMAVYGVDDVRKTPIRPVFSGQWGNPGVLQYGLPFIQSQIGTVNKFIHAGAIAPYIVCGWDVLSKVATGDATLTVASVLAGYQEGVSNPSSTDPGTSAFIASCDQYKIHKLAYEFGPDDGQSQSDVAVKVAAARDAGMAAICSAGIKNWFSAGCEGLNWFNLSSGYDSNGQWGLTDDISVLTTPKYQSVSQASIL